MKQPSSIRVSNAKERNVHRTKGESGIYCRDFHLREQASLYLLAEEVELQLFSWPQ